MAFLRRIKPTENEKLFV